MNKVTDELQTKNLASQIIDGIKNAQDEIIKGFVDNCGIERKGKKLFLKGTTVPIIARRKLYGTGTHSTLDVFEMHIEKIGHKPPFKIGILNEINVKKSKVDIRAVLDDELDELIKAKTTQMIHEQKVRGEIKEKYDKKKPKK